MTEPPNIENVLSEYAPLLARIAATHEANATIREDLIQDMSLAVWRGLASFRSEASVKTFVTRIAHNRAVDHVLRESRRNKHVVSGCQDYQQAIDTLDAHHNRTEQDNNQQEHRLDLMTALFRLPLAYRQVIAMQLEGFTQVEIAQILGLKETAIAKRASRARQQLEQWL